ncbi:MAG: hypothetical protein PVF27_05125 [Gemmatimonadales bacterium]|jgi:hypothetical protein
MRPLAEVLLLVSVGTLWGQEPEPFDSAAVAAGRPAVRIGLLGFAARAGADVGGEGQAVVGVSLDVGHVVTERLRLRPSGEIGVLNGDNTYVANLEVLYRFTPDTDVAVPYVGTGIGLAGRANCATVQDCPAVWLQFVLGFELQLRDQLAWFLEYHPEDAFRRQRVFIGLTTRRGS